MINVRHKFQSQKADGADDSLIQPTNWNDNHNLEMAGPAIVGRTAASQGVAQEISLGAGLSFSGTTITTGTIGGRNLTISTAAPSGGANGDIWLQV